MRSLFGKEPCVYKEYRDSILLRGGDRMLRAILLQSREVPHQKDEDLADFLTKPLQGREVYSIWDVC